MKLHVLSRSGSWTLSRRQQLLPWSSLSRCTARKNGDIQPRLITEAQTIDVHEQILLVTSMSAQYPMRSSTSVPFSQTGTLSNFELIYLPRFPIAYSTITRWYTTYSLRIIPTGSQTRYSSDHGKEVSEQAHILSSASISMAGG